MSSGSSVSKTLKSFVVALSFFLSLPGILSRRMGKSSSSGMETRHRVSSSAATSLNRRVFLVLMRSLMSPIVLLGKNVERERVGCCLSIDKTEQGQGIVGHGVAKHEGNRQWEEMCRM